MIILSGIRLGLGSTEAEAIAKAKLILGGNDGEYHLRKMSYDLRKGNASQVCSVTAALESAALEKRIAASNANARYVEKTEFKPVPGNIQMKTRPVVVGSGPAGLFAAYLLSLYDYCPILLERGGDVDSRVTAVDSFFAGGPLDYRTNVQFGEGGAGTFSDGKLTTRINDELCEYVIDTFCRFGAPEDIRTRAKPHIGTDNLRNVIKNIRNAIVENGGTVKFNCAMKDIVIRNNSVVAVETEDGIIPTETVILAIGHSAHDTFDMLMTKGVSVSAKPFSVGMRIEHLQSDVDRSLYGELAGDPRLPKGEYTLSAKVGDRAVYTFCMCPGGQVVAAASEANGTVTNGMSNYARDGENANSAVCVSVGEKDFGRNPYRALEFQRDLERTAYAAAGGNFAAPACDVGAFLDARKGLSIGRVKPTYPRDLAAYDMERIFGTELSESLREGLRVFSRKISCFGDREAILTGVETRTSSPIRIERDESRQAVGLTGLYPCGEGAGYSGGITSSAVDGLRSAAAVIEKYKI